MSDELAALIARRFIQRRDVKAVQFSNGKWSPDREIEHLGSWGPLGFKMSHLQQHLAGTHTYGHYLLDDSNLARVFAFDLDLEKTGYWCNTDAGADSWNPQPCNPREEWANRASPARSWLKTQMSILGRKLATAITTELQAPCAVAYSGSKGIHVYGFTPDFEPRNAESLHKAALYILAATGDWELSKGKHFFRHKLRDPELGYPNFSLEVFPKQGSLEGKDLGNLMRLPLGHHQKSPDPCFFLDLNSPVGALVPHKDPIALLSSGNPFA